jgi:predicted GIY-YIG superfamily endonuclease
MAKKKHPGGRPTKMTENTIGKLDEAFCWGCTDTEACLYADIHPDTLYEYIKKHPEYSDRKEALKENPVMLARASVVKSIKSEENPELALKYLERKKKDEFGVKQTVEVEGIEAVLKRLGDPA